MAASEDYDDAEWEVRFREDDELEFFTELALHETERWVTAVTKKQFGHPDDPRKSLENGILLCELLNSIKPGSVKRINKLPTPIAGLDNLHVFLRACREHFGLNDTHLFDPADLEDLSQRAIAESDHLKLELDRRLRNVAITVYWLGRVARQTYPGPKIDESAFSALVHNQHRHREHIVSDSQLRKDSSCSWESSQGPRGSGHGRGLQGSISEAGEGAQPRHARDGSFDSHTSYGKESEDSLEEAVFELDENGMPIPRYNSSSGLNRSRDSGTGQTRDRDSAMYRSSPDLSHHPFSNRRSSSTDSADGSHYGGHSRQSSDSVDYPTRRYSTQHPARKTSVSADPLQFIKSKGATDLAVTAEEQMKLAAETKKMKVIETIGEDDSTDWQSNLSSWKNRRKSQSEKSYQLKEELEQTEREKEGPRPSASSTKTFSQMKEERERRKSAGTKHFYPIEDEGEDDIFAPAKAEQQQSSPASRSGSRFQASPGNKDTKGSGLENDVADWAKDSEGSEDEEVIKSTSKAAVSAESQSRFSRDSDGSSARQRRSGNLDFRSGGRESSRDSWSSSTPQGDGSKESAHKENNRNSANNMSSSAASSVKSPNKISNILRNFEQKEEDAAKPRASASEAASGSVSAHRKSFEKVGSLDSSGYRPWSTGRDVAAMESTTSSRSERLLQTTPASSAYTSSKTPGKASVEKKIKISQKPNKDTGFGFTLSGGADKKQPVIVEKVSLGSAADVCELQTKDEVISINGQSVAGMTSMELTQKVKDAVRVGQIELKVKRFLGSNDEFEDDEDFLSTDEEIDTPDRESKSSSLRAENSFDSLDSREEQQKAESEQERQWIEEDNSSSITKELQISRRGGPTSTSSDSGYEAQHFSPYNRGENSSNEEEMVSSQQLTEIETRPSLASRTRHLYPRDDEEEEGYPFLPGSGADGGDVRNDNFSEEGRQVEEHVPACETTVELRPSITVRREKINAPQIEEREDKEPGSRSSQQRGKERPVDSNDGEDSDGGPPAALRKWQRQRPRADYTFESDETPKFYDQMKLAATVQLQMENPAETPEETRSQRTEMAESSGVPSRRGLDRGSERRRMKDWNQQMEEDRQQPRQFPSDSDDNAVEVTFPFDQQRFAAEQEKLQQQYQSDLQRAADVERQKQEQERQLLEPEMEKTRLLEERRAQRQARIQQYAQEAAEAPLVPPTQQHTSTFTAQIQEGRAHSTPAQPELLVIDPRNRAPGDAGQPIAHIQEGHPYQFHLKLNSRETPQGLVIQPEMVPAQQSPLMQQDHAAFLEAERERIRQEELQKIEAERRRMEEEELRQIRSKEEQLRQKEEMLQQQQEDLRRKQEQLERERQQMQYIAHQPPPPQQQQPPSMQYPHHEVDDTLHFETVTSKVRGGSPAYTSTISTGPRRSEGRPQTSGSYDRRQNAGGYSDRNQQASGPSMRRSEPSWNNSQQPNSASWKGGNNSRQQNAVSQSQSSLPRWPPSSSGNEHHSRGGVPSQYSREDMMAMNRKATPLQSKPPSMSASADPAPLTSPIRREAPSKGQLHSLNSVPKAKFRNPDQWITDEVGPYPPPPHNASPHSPEARSQPNAPMSRRSDNFRSQFAGTQDHWLVQEAERRRMQDSGQGQGMGGRAHFSGPIKPVGDDYGNRWRGGNGSGSDMQQQRPPNMPAQIRQTLLQKTAGARTSTGSSSSQDSSLPPPHHYGNPPPHSLSQTLPPDYMYGGDGYSQGPRSGMVPPQHRAPSPEDLRENGVAVSGKQQCSHCNQELGFGAAMVIESLGLFYHTQCFKCCVCRTPLGNGVEGADVRVRVNKLHCRNCYSNDEAGLKFSKV